jgi:hypothetical protein
MPKNVYRKKDAEVAPAIVAQLCSHLQHVRPPSTARKNGKNEKNERLQKRGEVWG